MFFSRDWRILGNILGIREAVMEAVLFYTGGLRTMGKF